MGFSIRRTLAPVLVALGMLSLSLRAQQPDSTTIAVRQLVERARRLADRGDTLGHRQALAVLDSAERIARIDARSLGASSRVPLVGGIWRERAIIGVAYAEQLLAGARATHTCPDVRRAEEVVKLADAAMPSDDLSNSPRLLHAAVGLAALKDSLASLRRTCL